MSAITPSRPLSLRAGIAVERLSIAWMVVELVAALGAGFAARSVSLETFGIDSAIELVAGWALLRRLAFELRLRSGTGPAGAAGEERIARAERRASRIVGWGLYALAAYVVLGVALGLVARARPEASPTGIGLAAASALVMPGLVIAKRRVAERIGSAALRADAACGVVCAYMAATVLLGLALNALLGWWWADDAAALALLWFIVREGREALEKAEGQDTCCDD
jgi:hypothetical protein